MEKIFLKTINDMRKNYQDNNNLQILAQYNMIIINGDKCLMIDKIASIEVKYNFLSITMQDGKEHLVAASKEDGSRKQFDNIIKYIFKIGAFDYESELNANKLSKLAIGQALHNSEIKDGKVNNT